MKLRTMLLGEGSAATVLSVAWIAGKRKILSDA
jgi:hypothetical protein